MVRLQVEDRVPDMKGGCKYTEHTVTDSGKGMALQLGGSARCQQLKMLQNISQSLSGSL